MLPDSPTGDTVRIAGDRPLTGTLAMPGDKSISHRALMVAALARGTSIVHGLSHGADVAATRGAVAALGARVVQAGTATEITGGRDRLSPPGEPIDCGNSGTTMRLLAGIVAGLDGTTVLTGDPSLSGRPMDRIAVPLTRMGAVVSGRGERCLPPLSVVGATLEGIRWEPPVASAQVKSAVLLAGLGARGETVVVEPVATRAHTEELLALAGARITVEHVGSGRVVRLQPSDLEPLDLTVPGDPSQAAFWVVAASLVPGSTVRVANLYAGAERIGFVHVLRRMGAAVELEPCAGTGHQADLVARSAPLHGTVVRAEEIPSLDEVPALAVAAAAAEGVTEFLGMGELRVKESDRLQAVCTLVRSLGAGAEITGDDLRVQGVGPAGRLRHGPSHSGGDHRMAMAAAVAALAAGPGESEVSGFACVGTSYPGFLADLQTLGGGPVTTPGPGAATREAPGGRAGGPAGRDRTQSPASAERPGRIIAIDGPAGSGKSTVSVALAGRLGMARLDTGAMYRAVAWAALQDGTDLQDHPAVAALAAAADLQVGTQVLINGTDVTAAIRTPEVSRAVSAVAANPEVRRVLVDRQRAWARTHGGGVVEGRDIGTVVFPQADLKVYLTASPEERARRRHEETPEGVARRDHLDSTRAASPLAQAGDAVVVDTTGRTVEQVVEEVVSCL